MGFRVSPEFRTPERILADEAIASQHEQCAVVDPQTGWMIPEATDEREAIANRSKFRNTERNEHNSMTGIQAIIVALETTQGFLENVLGDFTDADMLVRPVPAANHAAWQIGNVIVGDSYIVSAEIPTAKFPELPAGFMDLHSGKGTSKDTDPGFLTKAGYLKLFAETRTAAIAAVSQLYDADLDRPSSESMKWAGPTLAHVLLTAANHTLMHAGQFSVIRRKLGKPVLF